MGAARKYLEEIEWEMGNGQCPKCYGLNPDWYNGLNNKGVLSEDVGHKKSCELALALLDTGSSPIYKQMDES